MVDRAPRATDTDGLLLGDLQPGARIGEYVVEAMRKGHGSGHVYEAVHVVLPRRATIRVMPAAQGWSRAVALELLREACIVDALDHPGIPRLYECGTLADRRPWTATELVAGATLADAIDQRTIEPFETAAIVRDVAEILDHAHRRGLVHCAVTPAAIVLPTTVRRFPLCLVDWFGARTLDSNAPIALLPPSRIRYASPEQRRGELFDGRADVYALGVIAKDLLRRASPELTPPVFNALVARMIEAEPARRPTAGEVRDHVGWLADQIEPAHAIPEPIDDDRTELSRR